MFYVEKTAFNTFVRPQRYNNANNGENSTGHPKVLANPSNISQFYSLSLFVHL